LHAGPGRDRARPPPTRRGRPRRRGRLAGRAAGRPSPGRSDGRVPLRVWQYLDEGTRDAIWSRLAAAGSAAGPDAPVAWLRLEPTPVAYVPAELRLTVWDGREAEPADRLLATSGFHGGPVTWMPSSEL